MALEEPARTLTALGYTDIPALSPLTYPGRPVTAPALLHHGELHALPVDGALDDVIKDRTPVLAVGSNASPAQIAYKLTRLNLPVSVPMIPVETHGIGIGCSAHIGRNGYVAAAPYEAPGERRTLVVTWLDDTQLKAVDATELPNYRRVPVPDAPVPGLQLYVSEYGVLTDPETGGAPRPGGGDQAALLTALMALSPALRSLLGPTPADWVRRAAASPSLRERGTLLLRETGLRATPWPH
ncbi:hypothetical protein [Streptomyces sp. VRA16 Mangrove soil]|uniref:hypothetical protein n=1 Tax=Streptomyces sp. VRA16 Mangrove soil TaxID=2817434 RepID=UPI001A9F6E61|nr:hypothetical protein [Streptomyces sp. VRA16 Mangrove soil]MBO1336239.1 hypothetical protein [Streptomyces sp. VRA16 Mangrove soil]